MQPRVKIVVSDVHIGTGHKKGRPNVFDDFRYDDQFVALLRKVDKQFAADDLELVINGDFFDLLAVPVNGLFPEAITESIGTLKLDLCLRGHPKVVGALQALIEKPHRRITYVPGNHDMEFLFPNVRRHFCRTLTGKDADDRVQFITDREKYRLDGGVEIHHGHQFEALNSFDFQQLILDEGLPEPILNLPWGSLFVLQVLHRFKEERPYLDRVKPFWPLVAGGLFFDTRFTLKGGAIAAYYWLRFQANPLWAKRRPFASMTKVLSSEVNLFEGHEKTAERLFKADPTLKALVMGHTHTEMVRTYDRGERVYVNTGTWVPMVNVAVENLGQNVNQHYAMIRWTDAGEPRVSLMRWHGKRPTVEEIWY